MKAVGVPFVKKDAKALVTGKPVYTNDLAPKDWLITTPAACMDVCRGRPSSLFDISISSFTCGSSS